MKTVVITGGSRGIGAETARLFSDKGYRVILGYRTNEDAALRLTDEIKAKGGEAYAFSADVTSTPAMEALMKTAFRFEQSIDALVCSAGVAKQQLLTDVTDKDYREIMDINMGGVFRACRAVVPYFLCHHRGAIVTISSMWGISGASMESVYSASKAAVIGFSKALASELAPSGIRVNCVAPGVIDTDMNADFSQDVMNELRDRTPIGKIGTPRQVADAIYFLADDASSFITGQTLSVDGGFLL